MRRDRKTAAKAQTQISALDKYVSSLSAEFRKYEKGNPYWDNTVTFTLDEQDDDDDADSDDGSASEGDAPDAGVNGALAKRTATAATDLDTGAGHGADVAQDASPKKPAKPDVIVKFDEWAGTQWQKFLRQQRERAQAQRRRGGRGRTSRSSLMWTREGVQGSPYKKRVGNDMAFADFLE